MFFGDLQQTHSPTTSINPPTNSLTPNEPPFLFSHPNISQQQSASKQQSNCHSVSYQYITKPPHISTKQIQFSCHEDAQKFQQLRNNKKKTSTNTTSENRKTEFVYKQPPTYLHTPYKKQQQLPNSSKFDNSLTKNGKQQNCKQPPHQYFQQKHQSASSNTISQNTSFSTYNSNNSKVRSINNNSSTSISANIMNTFYKQYYPNRNISKMGTINQEKHKCFRDTLNLKSELSKLQEKHERLQYDHYILQKKYNIYSKGISKKTQKNNMNDLSRTTSQEDYDTVRTQIATEVQGYQMSDASDKNFQFHIKKLQQEKLELMRECQELKDQLQKYLKTEINTQRPDKETESNKLSFCSQKLRSQALNLNTGQSHQNDSILVLEQQNKILRGINQEWERKLNENYTKNIEKQLQIQAIREQYHRDMTERARYIQLLTQKYEAIKQQQQTHNKNIEENDNTRMIQQKNIQINQMNKINEQLKLTNQTLQQNNNKLSLQIKQLKTSCDQMIDQLLKNKELLQKTLNDNTILSTKNMELCEGISMVKQQQQQLQIQFDKFKKQNQLLQKQLESISQERNQEKQQRIVENRKYSQLLQKSEYKQNQLLRQIEVLKQSILIEQEKNLSYRNIISQKQSTSQNALAKYHILVQENKKFLQVLQSKAELFAQQSPNNAEETPAHVKQMLNKPVQTQSSQILKQKEKQQCTKCQKQFKNLQKEDFHNLASDNPEQIKSQTEIQQESLLQICDILGIEPVKGNIIDSIKHCLTTNQEMTLITDFYIQILDLFGIGYTEDTGEDSEAIFINSETQQQLLKEITSFRQSLKNLLSKTKQLESLNDRLIKENNHLKKNNKKLDIHLNESILSKQSSLLIENNLQVMKMKAIILSFQYQFQQQSDEEIGGTTQYR